ncbi:MAG: primosomal protein N' [Chloroflexi bacterium]|nr:primosomal protein N' [Chloroflexota bacterium]
MSYLPFKMKYAEIVVNTPLAASGNAVQAFTYSIPARLADALALGQLVWVPFGARRVQGIVVLLGDTSPVDKTKDIDAVVDPRPFLSAARIDLARWIARTYLCSLNDAIQLMLPTGIEQEPELLIALAPDPPLENLNAKQAALVELLRRDGEAKLRALPRELRAAVEPLARRGVVVKRSLITPPRAKPKRVKSVRLISEEAIGLLPPRSQPKAQKIADVLRGEPGAVWVSAVYAGANCALHDLRRLEALGVVALEEEEVLRDSLATRTFDVVEPPKLTPEQEAAWREIEASLKSQVAGLKSQTAVDAQTETWDLGPATWDLRPATCFLLHGVTGSGKTEIYLRALDEILKQGKQGIVLVPEISLTPQTIRRFGAWFPNRLAVLHSRLSLGERYDTWRRCRDGKVDIVIGSRSALCAPLPNLGLIAIDEEHEPAYKQESVPHYHARAVALELARRVGATVILGSATPDLETYYRATRGEFRLLELPQRIMGHLQVIESEITNYQLPTSKLAVREIGANYQQARYQELPPVEIVDLRAELKAGNRSIFSRALQREMARVLAAREQVILFLNRRGTATFILCRDCGNVFKCRRCDNPMTYHGAGEQLVCHHCNRRDRVPTRCPNCMSARIRYFGTGTQKVEEEIQTMFPTARTLRWDFDVTRGKESHEAILEKFVQHQADILIGTQMIAKGLDLPLVTLVGVVSADTSLNLPDFRAGERTFQLLTQVAGRAGRSILGGKVILQTYAPDHYAIQAASRHDYGAFYARELAFRREQNYPPFSRLIRLLYTNPSDKRAAEAATQMQRLLATRIAQRGLPALDLIGPAPAFFHRVRGAYRYQLLIRGADPHALLQGLALPLGWRVDVDPVSVL